jgi:hypothetical protein
MRTPVGDYRIDFYNRYGERLPGRSLLAKSLIAAHETAQTSGELVTGDSVSYTINRCLFNSLDANLAHNLHSR